MKQLLKHPFPYLFALLLCGLYYAVPYLSEWVVSKPVYAKYAGKDAVRIVNYIQSGFVAPFHNLVSPNVRNWIVLPYLVLFGFLSLGLVKSFPRFWKWFALSIVGVGCFVWLFPNSLLWFENNKPSKSIGTVSRGSIQNSKRLPFQGNNFTSYSFPLYVAGRTYVHENVRKTLKEAFLQLEEKCPEVTFVIGETGLKKGGHFPPHRTHRNGLSVDIMIPLLKRGKPTKSHHLFNLWGYGLEFDNKGKANTLEIDYETLAILLGEIKKAASNNGLRIQKVIFDPVLKPYLFKTPSGNKIRKLPFTKNRVVIRHDNHIHIDFEVL